MGTSPECRGREMGLRGWKRALLAGRRALELTRAKHKLDRSLNLTHRDGQQPNMVPGSFSGEKIMNPPAYGKRANPSTRVNLPMVSAVIAPSRT